MREALVIDVSGRGHSMIDRNAAEVETGSLLSVVIPTFNGSRHIHSCLSSVLSQPIENLEIVVSDGGSTDDTVSIVRSFADDRVRVVEAEQRIPIERNWTQACELSHGTFVKLLCQDDVIAVGALAHQRELLIHNPRAVAAVGPREIIDDAGGVLMSRRGARGLSGSQPGRVVLRKAMLAGGNILGEPSAVLFRSRPLMSCLPWSARFPYMLDLECYARILQLGDVVSSDQAVASFRVHRGSWSVELGDQQVKDFCRWADWLIDNKLIDVRPGDRLRSRIATRSSAFARQIVYRFRVN